MKRILVLLFGLPRRVLPKHYFIDEFFHHIDADNLIQLELGTFGVLEDFKFLHR